MDWRLDGIYCGPAPVPGELWGTWNLDPALLTALAAAVFLLRGSRAGFAACAVLAVAFVSPLCALSAALFSARVAHHVLLVVVAAPLFAMARPARNVPGIALPFLLSTASLWLWHLPAAYDLALANKGVYWIMQATLLGTATLFWRAVLRPRGAIVPAVVWTLAGFIAMGVLGAILTFAPAPLYAAHAVAPFAWGLTPLADQQLGGLLMWVPASIPYLVVIALVARDGWTFTAARTT